jgi:uncharacterized protein
MPYEEEIDALHAARVARLRAPTGWLSLVGKIFLHEGDVRLGADEACGARLPSGPPVVGTLTIARPRVTLDVAPGVEVLVDGAAVQTRELRTDAGGSPDTLTVGDLLLQVMERGDTLALRVRDRRGATEAFPGISRFAIDPTWRKVARFEPHAPGAQIHVEYEGAHEGDVSEEMACPGTVVFDVDGIEQRLEVLLEDGGKRLYIPFRDRTNGVESYDTGRFLYTSLPDASGSVILDFNQAMLPGCAFTSFATCPIPPQQNRLQVSVPAGEKRFLGEPVGAS